MGVQSLWTLLEPVGRRINIEALANKRLAVGMIRFSEKVPLLLDSGKLSCSVDASIWVNQFLKAMRNQQGEVIHNAHLLGFFRRICKYGA
jgi:DNA excision repair protein ERCC-5